jgi:parallel beta-helix repeat protein
VRRVRPGVERLEGRDVPSAYYVSTAGSDANPGTLAQPFATVNHGASVLAAGDTLYVRGGTYNESLLNDIPSGTASAPVTVSAYPGEAVTLQAPASAHGRGIDLSGSFQYIHILNLTLDGSLTAGNASADGIKISYADAGQFASHILVSGCTIAHFGSQGILITSDPATGDATDHNQILNCNIYDNGSAQGALGHGMYVVSNDNLIQGCSVHDNAGNGMQIYGPSGDVPNTLSHNTVTGNTFYDNGWASLTNGGSGLTVWYGDSNLVSNNLCYGNTGAGIQITSGASNTQVLNNTCYGNQGLGGKYGLSVGSGAANTKVLNNIAYGNGGPGGTSDYHVGATTTATVGDYNLSGDATAIGAHSLPNTNPLFVNAAAGDFHLSATSPAIDAGVALPAVAVDFDGVSRPQGLGYDIGAYEYPAGVPGSTVKHFSVGTSAVATAGSSFSVVVTALDANNQTASAYRGTVHFTSSDSRAVLPADYTFSAADAGSHTFTVTLKAAGSQSVTATDSASSSVSGQATVVVSAAAASILEIGTPASASAGSPFSITVTAGDAYGNTAVGYTGTVHFASSDGQAALPADYTFTAADAGAHTFTVTLRTAGSQSLTATDTTTGPIAGSAGVAAGSVTVTALPVTVAAPTNLTATAVSGSQIDLAWADNADNETGFLIERSRDGVHWLQVATVGPAITSFSNTGLSWGTKYYYRVRAINTDPSPAVYSAYSNVASATTQRT